MSEGVLAHHGAGISASGLDAEDEAFLAALVRGELPMNDEDDLFSQIILRCHIQHAFTTEAERLDVARTVLRIWDRKPDDAGTIKMVSGGCAR